MKKDILQKLVRKYLNGECSPQEISILNEWYNSFDEAQNPIDSLSEEQQLLLKHRLLTRIRNNVASSYVKPDTNMTGSISRVSRKQVYLLTGIAAMALLVTGIFLFRNVYMMQGVHSVSPEIVIINKTKSIQKILLEDESIVWLNPESKISYPKKFPSSSREIQMTGEAFFEVKPDTKRPFIIYSNDIVTRVWGTSFFVRANENIPAEVSVITGKVSVRSRQQNENSEVMLLPDQKVTFFKTSNLLKKEKEKRTSALRIWRKTTLSFDNTPLREVFRTLNEKFDVNINASETFLDYTLKADFTDQSLPSILEMLKKSLDVEYEINGHKITLNN